MTFTAVADVDAPKGNALAVWQNKVWVPGSAQVSWSDAGSVTSWTSRRSTSCGKDDETVVALAGSSGVDISGRPGLLAYKNESALPHLRPVTGDYETLTTVGAASALSVVTSAG